MGSHPTSIFIIPIVTPLLTYFIITRGGTHRITIAVWFHTAIAHPTSITVISIVTGNLSRVRVAADMTACRTIACITWSCICTVSILTAVVRGHWAVKLSLRFVAWAIIITFRPVISNGTIVLRDAVRWPWAAIVVISSLAISCLVVVAFCMIYLRARRSKTS